jgi:hypothetical protein
LTFSLLQLFPATGSLVSPPEDTQAVLTTLPLAPLLMVAVTVIV